MAATVVSFKRRSMVSAASRVKLLRTQADYTQAKFASYIGVSGSTISAWEHGRAFPSRLARIRLYEYERGLIKKPVEIRWVYDLKEKRAQP